MLHIYSLVVSSTIIANVVQTANCNKQRYSYKIATQRLQKKVSLENDQQSKLIWKKLYFKQYLSNNKLTFCLNTCLDIKNFMCLYSMCIDNMDTYICIFIFMYMHIYTLYVYAYIICIIRYLQLHIYVCRKKFLPISFGQ